MKTDFAKNISLINKDSFLTGSNFSSIADVVYAEAIDYKKINKLNKDNIETISQWNEDVVIYSIKNFTLKENQIIFCKTDFILDLFVKLKKVKLKNIKLITHQAATPMIDKHLYKLKPKCISEWFSINVSYVHENLIPIPLGLGNEFSKVGIHPDDIKEVNFNNEKNRIEKIYCNFDVNTNLIRKDFLKFAKTNKNIFETSNKRIEKLKFLEKLLNYKFVLCPPGVGVDTHRFWEALYLGCIPVTKKNYIYERFFSGFYISFKNIEELTNIRCEDIGQKEELIKKLNLSFWEKIIKKNNIDSTRSVYINVDINRYRKNRDKLRKSYTRYKILRSNFTTKTKFIDYLKTFKNLNQKLFDTYWR